MKLRIGLLSVCLFVLSLPMIAQDFRGAISGTVKDASGALLPGVTITIRNTETNVSNTTVTDERGAYQVRYLNAGTYDVQAQLEGLQTVQRKGVSVRVAETIPVDFKLEQGAVSEVMVVTASAPIIDTTSGVTGTTVDSNQIQQLPLGDGTAYMLTRLAPGVMDSSDLHFSRPMDNGNLAGLVANGAQGGNEFTLDGAPNRVSPNNFNAANNNGVVGFSPPSDAISQFKIQTNAFDAQSGHTAGATVNLALKSGTNDWKGAVSYFNRSDARSATPLLSKRAGADKPTREYNRYTGTFSGPVIKDRTFFMVSFEHLKDIQPEPSAYTVPTAKMRAGDMSEWTGAGNQVYDPLTSTGSNNARTAFAGNIIPQNRINAIAKAYAALYPLPNRPGLEDNYFTNMLRPYDYNAVLLRGDHNFNGANKLFLNAYWNKRQEDRYNWALGAENAQGQGEIGGFLVTQGFDYRSNKGATLGYTTLIHESLAVDVIGAWSQFGEWRTAGGEIDPAALGFSSQVVSLMNGYKYLPFITFGGFSSTNANSRMASLGSQRSDFGEGFSRPFTNISLTPTASWIMGEHSLRAGYEMRNQRWNITAAPYGAGRYYFNGAYTRANNSGATNVIPQSWAQFLLGIPTTGTGAPATVSPSGCCPSQFEIAANADYRQISHSLFAQDDWSFNQRLTLNLGARFEYDQAMREEQDRNIRGFNTTLTSPVAAAAIAKYAANPIPEIAAAAFKVNGGLEFADGPIYNDLHKILPRAAFSYLINDRTVIRGGAGLFSYDFYFDAGNQIGFSQPTGIISTLDNGKTFLADISNPGFTALTPPTGSSLGAATGLGGSLGTIVPAHRESPYYTRWQLGGQRDFGGGWSVEAFYVDSRGRDLPVQREIDGVPFQYLSTATQRDTANETFLSGSVPNPFAGLLPGTGLNGANTTRGQLLRPYPQFTSIILEQYTGSDHYQAGSIRIDKRFRSGNSLIATYTRSRTTDKLFFLNPAKDELENRISPNDRPNRATLGATIRLPFGHGSRYGSNWNAITDAILGGWTISATYQYQDGFPLTWSTNLYYDPARNPKDLVSNIGGKCPGGGTAGLDCTAWDTSGFYIDPNPNTRRSDQRISMGNTVRRFPSTLPNVRTDNLHLLDLGVYKTFGLPADIDLQVRIEVINALNYTVLWNPNQDPTSASFGLVNQDRNNPRDIQLGAKLTF
jgi:hypothetical protein